MTSTGNDIVALNVKISAARRPAFSGKILCTPELALYQTHACNAISFNDYTWLLWSVKEAVYKFHQRHHPSFRFAPKKIIVTTLHLPPNLNTVCFGTGSAERKGIDPSTTVRCVVEANGKVFYSASVLFSECVHSIAGSQPGFDDVWWGIRHISTKEYAQQSAEVRSFLLQRLGAIFPGKKFRVDKVPDGHPYLLNDETVLAWPVSFTHHDQYVAYSLVLQEN